MSAHVQVALYGSLQNPLEGSSIAASIQLELEKPSPLVDGLDGLGIPLELVQ
jgi:hypothetical protein